MHILTEIAETLEPDTEDGSPADEQTTEEAELYGIPLLGFRNHKPTCGNVPVENGDEDEAEHKKDDTVA